ncbi:hypothetical protein [Haloarchaeobius sp. DFWS5]|uniref:hypothetical protein n=1 Tax=Haloarchaeobius sp. DFWS5 TaxID=3446114 RepID=UPI003EBC7F80
MTDEHTEDGHRTDDDVPAEGDQSDEPLSGLREELTADESEQHEASETTASIDAAESTESTESTADESALPQLGTEADTRDRRRDGPLGDVAAELDGRRRRRDATDDDLFESVDVGEIDTDELWDQVAADEPVGPAEAPSETRRTVAKAKYCQRCEFFSAPPEVGCGHDGTRIVEEADIDHFEVANCPKVREDEALENV